MPSLTLLLTRLERLDTYPAGAALHQVLEECLADPNADEQMTGAALVMFNDFFKQGAGEQAYQAMVEFVEDRLTNWHSLKVNAVKSAWDVAQVVPQDPEQRRATLVAMRDAILVNLRQGIHDDPRLLADAHYLQGLAKAGHPFRFTQALRDLRAEGLPLPAEDQALRDHCVVAVNAFQYLIG